MRRQRTPRWRCVESAPFSALLACSAFGLSRGLNELPRSSSVSSCTVSDETERSFTKTGSGQTRQESLRRNGPIFAHQDDILKLKLLGFNMVRKHILREPDRWYHYADVHGVVVWQDMPSSFNLSGAVAQQQFRYESGRPPLYL